MEQKLHADHIDETGAYSIRFKLVQELMETGNLTETPAEFSVQNKVSEVVQIKPIENNKEFNFIDGHADHIDETGEYRRQWEMKFGNITNEIEDPVTMNWKTFLQNLIVEEKAKLNI